MRNASLLRNDSYYIYDEHFRNIKTNDETV